MRSASCMTRTGKQTTLQANKTTHTGHHPYCSKDRLKEIKMIRRQSVLLFSAGLRKQNQKLATSSHWLPRSWCIFQNNIKLFIQQRNRKLVFSVMFSKSVKIAWGYAFHVGPLHICCKIRQLKCGFWIHFHVSESCSLQWLVLWDFLRWCSVWKGLVHISHCSIHRDSMQSFRKKNTPSESVFSSDSDF